MTMRKKSEQLDWLQNQMSKDNDELIKEKNKLIEDIKKLKKEDLVKKPEQTKISLWKRIIKVLIG